MSSSSTVELSVVLPAYLEGENLNLLLPRVVETLRSLGVGFEIVVVDTEEPLDNTRPVCDKHGARYVNRRGGNSFGAAIRTGIEEAKGDRLLFMDADGSHTPEFIPALWAHAGAFDVVIASRYVDKGQTENSLLLVTMSRILNFAYSVILDLPCKDVSNSFKIYRAEQVRPLNLRCENFDIVEEILFKLRRRYPGLSIKEVPYCFKKRMFGETKRNLLLFILTFLFTMLRLRFRP